MFKFHRRTRWRYWSNTELAQRIRGTLKPKALSWQGWKAWRVAAENAHPIRYWISDTLLNHIQDFVMFPGDVWYSIRCYCSNRFKTKTHVLRTSLEVGQWHEFNTRLIHGLFDTFCYFVETEQCSSDIPSRAEGMCYLIWASNLRYGNGDWVKPEDPLFGTPTHQALAAREQIRLYTWWRDVRPVRIDPYDSDTSPEEWDTLEAQYEAEDEEMMISLIKLRQSIWS